MKKNKDIDKIIFLWDYVDSFDISDELIIKNLQDIIIYKKDNMEKVELLLGNHDIQYMFPWNQCSGYRKSYSSDLRALFMRNIDLFKIAHQEQNHIFSHAWFNSEWLTKHKQILWQPYPQWITETINNIFNTQDRNILFECWPWRWGKHKSSWPLWSDKTETIKHIPHKDIMQIVWHTPVKTIEYHKNIIYTDTLEHGDWQALIIELQENEHNT